MYNRYLMEGPEEITRLEMKTEAEPVIRICRLAGLNPGMKVADILCGTGKTSEILYSLVEPGGEVIGFDASQERITYAEHTYGKKGISFRVKNILEPFDTPESFDFIWARFTLEYFKTEAFEIVKNLDSLLKSGGVLCLVDLDYNCLSHYRMPEKMESALNRVMDLLQRRMNFDPYAGRKLYSYLYDLGYTNIKADLQSHHLIYGEMSSCDEFNWAKKIEVLAERLDVSLPGYSSAEEFITDFKEFLKDPRRFSYTPVIACWGNKAQTAGRLPLS